MHHHSPAALAIAAGLAVASWLGGFVLAALALGARRFDPRHVSYRAPLPLRGALVLFPRDAPCRRRN